MKYRKEVNNFEIALALDRSQVIRLKGAIKKAYDQEWHKEGPNVDQINAFVAPYIKTPEEAFYVATVIVSDVMGAMNELIKTNVN
jgi:hypothetical protein